MHCWGDEWFEKYGDDLYKAHNYISDFTYRWTRCRLCAKEKYGTIRYEWMFPPGGGVFYRYAIWTPWKISTTLTLGGEKHTFPPSQKLIWAWNESWLYRRWATFGWYVCGIAIKKAIKRWPYLEVELCSDFMAPTKFGKQCEVKYWI